MNSKFHTIPTQELLDELSDRGFEDCILIAEQIHHRMVDLIDALKQATDMAKDIGDKIDQRQYWQEDARELVTFLTS